MQSVWNFLFLNRIFKVGKHANRQFQMLGFYFYFVWVRRQSARGLWWSFGWEWWIVFAFGWFDRGQILNDRFDKQTGFRRLHFKRLFFVVVAHPCRLEMLARKRSFQHWIFVHGWEGSAGFYDCFIQYIFMTYSVPYYRCIYTHLLLVQTLVFLAEFIQGIFTLAAGQSQSYAFDIHLFAELLRTR